MYKHYALLLAVGGAISGCASVQLEGAIGESCPAAVTATTGQINRAQLGFLGQLQVKEFELTQTDLAQTPRTDLLTKPIDATAVMNGLNRARYIPAVSITGVKSPTDMVPWIDEYSGVKSLSAMAVSEANNARAQIAHMWTSIPGTSSDFRAGSLPASQPVALGKLTSDDVAFASEVEKTLASGGYDALTLAAYDNLLALLENPTLESKSTLLQQSQEFNTARFLSTYFRAYFRGGRLLQVSLDTEALTKKISDDILDALKNDVQLKDEQKKRLTDAIKGYLQKTCRESKDSEKDACLLSRPLGEDSFVTRAGLSVQFAGVSISIGDGGKLAPALTYPQSTEFAPQLVRVAMEAAFDSHGLIVPAASNATACKQKLYTGANCLSDEDTKAAVMGGSAAERIKKLDMYASQAEATVTAATSKAIRGLAVAALNNEAVAKSLETMAGVSARKIVEKALWSRYRSGDACANAAGTVAVWVKN